MKKNNNKQAEEQKPKTKKVRKCVPMDGLQGVLMLFASVSIGYLITLVWLLTRDYQYLIGGAPAALVAAAYLVYKAKS